MLTWDAFSQLVGGLGLFLLGMWLLTEGLKLAGGHALQRILARWTVTRFRSFLSGFSLTAIVQSSSAVTVSVIGFINAGLLDLSHSLWIVFGSNVGTTMTAWIVTLIGFKFKVDILALPAIGIGAMFHLFTNDMRFKALGGALAGLGLLFLGLQLLQGAFTDLEQVVDIEALFTGGLSGMLLMVLIGLVLTALMQSSSAAMAIVLTAVSSGVLPLQAGAAAVIGANLGTTVTALLAVLKATASARRVAVAHVVFNVITALVAFALIGVFLALVQWLQESMELTPNAAVSLSMFHTIFNLLGVALMIPLEPRLTKWLATLFVRSEEKIVKPKYLDKNVISVPDLAINAVTLEHQRVFTKVKQLLSTLPEQPASLSNQVADLRHLISAVNEYVAQCSQQQLSAETAKSFQYAIGANFHLFNVLDTVEEVAALYEVKSILPEKSQKEIDDLLAMSLVIITGYSEILHTDVSREDNKQQLAEFENAIKSMSDTVVDQVRQQYLSAHEMEEILRQLSVLRRMVRQYVKACADTNAMVQQQLPEVLNIIDREEESSDIQTESSVT